MTTQPIKRRLDRIEATIALMEPERARRILTPDEALEYETLTKDPPGGNPFEYEFRKFIRWKELHFIKNYGYSVSELSQIKKSGSLAKAQQRKEQLS